MSKNVTKVLTKEAAEAVAVLFRSFGQTCQNRILRPNVHTIAEGV